MSEEVNVLNIRFNNVTKFEAVTKILNFIENDKKGYICTPNPEMLLESLNNDPFKKILNRSLLNIADGIGILWAATMIHENKSKLIALLMLPLIALFPGRFKKTLKQRVTGTDLMQEICAKAKHEQYKVFLLGATPGIAHKTEKKLLEKYPDLKIVGTLSGSPSNIDKDDIIKTINESEPDILFVAFGAPKQEMWIAENLKSFETVKIAIGVGGAFDFIAGKRKRAPRWMQKTGLEWFYRIIQEPSRWKRIFNATIKFPITVIKKLK